METKIKIGERIRLLRKKNDVTQDKLADHLGIPHTATIGMGDSDNDTAMIKAAALGLVMDNAPETLKEIADRVICNNDEHAVEYVMKEYF